MLLLALGRDDRLQLLLPLLGCISIGRRVCDLLCLLNRGLFDVRTVHDLVGGVAVRSDAARFAICEGKGQSDAGIQLLTTRCLQIDAMCVRRNV